MKQWVQTNLTWKMFILVQTSSLIWLSVQSLLADTSKLMSQNVETDCKGEIDILELLKVGLSQGELQLRLKPRTKKSWDFGSFQAGES